MSKPIGLDELILRIRHVGVCVYDMEKSIELIKKLFDVKDEDIQVFPTVESERRYVAIPVAGTEIMLKQFNSKTWKEMMGNPREGLFNIAFWVKDIEKTISILKERGIRLHPKISPEGPGISRPPHREAKAAYLDPETTGGFLIALIEPLGPARPDRSDADIWRF